jgi:folate-binding protein YgfZ
VPTLITVEQRAARRPRDYVRVAGADAEDFLQRMVSNDVTAAPCQALLLTPKARVIAPLVVVRRGPEDFLLLTEPGLGETVIATLTRARFAAKAAIEPEQHQSVIVMGSDPLSGVLSIPSHDYGGPAFEVIDGAITPNMNSDELERMRIEAGTAAWGKEIDDRVLPAEAGLTERAVSFTKGCYPGQEPIARLHHRGKANRGLRVLAIEGVDEGDELRFGDKVVGRITSAANGVALAYVRVEVPDDAELVTETGKARSLH